jgi:hypothetical protein
MDGGLVSERGLRQAARMLVGLAVLAEAAAGRSLPVRWFVLALLRHAERVVRNALIDETGWNPSDVEQALGFGIDPDGRPGPGSGPADAAMLAWRLRALAALLRALLSPADTPVSAESPLVESLRRLVCQRTLSRTIPTVCAFPAPDTS